MRLCRAVAAPARVGCFLSLIIQKLSDRMIRPDAPAGASDHHAAVRVVRRLPMPGGHFRKPTLSSRH